MFLRRTKKTEKLAREPPFKLHAWIEQALEGNDEYVVNPQRPSVMAYENGQLIDIGDSNPPRLVPGDLIWISFAVTFSIGLSSWGPKFRPIELVRVGHMQGLPGVPTDPDSNTAFRPPLKAGTFIQPTTGMSFSNCL